MSNWIPRLGFRGTSPRSCRLFAVFTDWRGRHGSNAHPCAAAPAKCYGQSLFPLLVLLATLGAASITYAQAARPNIVVMMTDDAGTNEFGFYSALMGQTTHAETPNLDALAQQSVVARQAYCTSPLCSPARAGLLTGQYQQRYGFEYNVLTTEGLSADQITIAQHLKTLGYTTGMVGKWHTGTTDDLNLPTDKGFDEFYGFWGGSRDYWFDTDPGDAIRRGDTFYENEYRAGGNPAEYDPVRGRYVTDAFGDEAADFITRRSAEENPYFLYLPFNAPHSPYIAKQSDLDHFAHVADPSDRLVAAMIYAVDRSVGKVMSAAEASGEETIFVFLSDHGGTSGHDNGPFQGSKGSTWEGGIRVPFLIKAPGLTPGAYDAPVSALDLLPTLYAAAGGDVSHLDSDGVDLMPHLSGSDPDAPHDAMFWRLNFEWAVRKGDWKLVNPDGRGTKLFNLAADLGETTDVSADHPDIVADLTRELTHWEATLAKPKWNQPPGVINDFDHFVWRGENAWFNVPNMWTNAGNGNPATLTWFDGYANLILEFRTKDSGGYGATNGFNRTTGQTFMINELRLTGNFTSTVFGHLAGFVGKPLLFVESLTGNSPKIRLDATSSGTPFRFRFKVGSELQLLDDLEITGDGTQIFLIEGAIRDFDEPRNVTKSGTSEAILSGDNTFRGDLNIVSGQIKLAGPNAAINGASSITIGSGASLVMESGLIAVPTIDRSAGGEFQFTGGELKVVDFIGDLTNQGGNYSPGASAGLSTISGNFAQAAGTLTMELAGTVPGTSYDQLNIGGTAQLGGALQVALLDGFLPSPGDTFDVITAMGGISGTFASTMLPELLDGSTWRLDYEPLLVRLTVEDDGATVPLPGDYNSDNIVDAADFIVWRMNLGSETSLVADGNRNGRVDDGDYQVWINNFGATFTPPVSGSAAPVPEPSAALLAILAALALVTKICRPARVTRP